MKFGEALFLLFRSLSALARISKPNDLVKVSLTGLPVLYFRLIAGSIFMPSFSGNVTSKWFVYIGNDFGKYGGADSHVVLFTSPKVLITSSDSKLKQQLTLSAQTRDRLVGTARSVAIKKVGHDSISSEAEREFLPYDKDHPVTVCVAFWINGQVRGSMMASGDNLDQAVTLATERAVVIDRRWKPLSTDDVKLASIEITIFSPLLFPVKLSTVKSIDYTKGYLSIYRDQIGLYVPEVFNAVRFTGPRSFFQSLAVIKGGVTNNLWQKSKFVTFDVCDFVGHAAGKTLELRGSMPKASSSIYHKVVAEQTVDWLLSRQEADGNIIPVTRVFEQQDAQVDWVRLSFSLYALAEWLNEFPVSNNLDRLELSLNYCKKHLLDSSFVSPNRLLGLVYLGQAYLSLGEIGMAESVLHKLYSHQEQSDFNQLQIYSLLDRYLFIIDKEKLAFKSWHQDLHHRCRTALLQALRSRQADCASWAEAVVAFRKSDPTLSKMVAEWLVEHQNDDGSFSLSKNNPFAYTRGSGKLFEVLAVEPAKYQSAIEPAVRWLTTMQYQLDNLYFVDPQIRNKLVGAFRHDYGNPDVWIDSASHFILGSVRMWRFENGCN